MATMPSVSNFLQQLLGIDWRLGRAAQARDDTKVRLPGRPAAGV